jgi:UDP-glucose 4-epimerase
VGGAGFIGGHLVDRLLAAPRVTRVTVVDNFSSGREWHLSHHKDDPRLAVQRETARNLRPLREGMVAHDTVVHLASNPDIARALTEPRVDFDEGTLLTFNVLEAMREVGCNRILYASGSGVYGDLGDLEVDEDYGPLIPVSTYGASKLAGEVMISAYCSMFNISACVFRFANVVGPRQTHGVGFDFLRKLRQNPARLEILGDGNQSKSYIHIDDVLSAVLLAHEVTSEQFRVYNVASGDYITVSAIAGLAAECAGLKSSGVEYVATGGTRGWKGDVPIVRLDTNRIRKLGWHCKRSSEEALRDALDAMVTEADHVFAPDGG